MKWTASGDASDRGDVASSAVNADDAKPEVNSNLESDAVDTSTTAEIYQLPAEVLRYVDSPAAMTSSELPVTLSTGKPSFSTGLCSDVASTANNAPDDVTVTSSKLFPVASVTACTATAPLASSSGASAVAGAVQPFPRASPMPTRILHSPAELFPVPVPVPKWVGQRAPFVVGGLPVALSSSAVPLVSSRWLPVLAQPASGPRGPSPSLDSPAADYFRKRHVTGCCGPQIGYFVANCRSPSDLRFRGVRLRPNSAEISHAPPLPPVQSTSVDPPPPRRLSTSSRPLQVPVESNSTDSSDDVIAKLDPVSRAVYVNFLGKLRGTTAKPKTGTGRRRGHVIADVARRYRN